MIIDWMTEGDMCY